MSNYITDIYAKNGYLEFSDLTEEDQKKLINECLKNSTFSSDFGFFAEHIIERYKEILENVGFEDPEINYSGFYCQGDGASFTTKNVDIEKFINYLLMCEYHYFEKMVNFWFIAADKQFVDASVERHSNYVHERSIHANVDDSVGISADKLKFLEDSIEEIAREFSGKIYSDLEEEWESINSEAYTQCELEQMEDISHLFSMDGRML